MDELSRTLSASVEGSMNRTISQANENAKIIKEVTSEITKVTEGQKQMVTLNDQLLKI